MVSEAAGREVEASEIVGSSGKKVSEAAVNHATEAVVNHEAKVNGQL